MFEIILDVFLDALKDSAITFPILFICYLLIELLEEKILHKYQSSKALKSNWAPVVGAGIGLIPQCGFSVVASDLYSKKLITIGSLFAILIATSDEAIPIMLAHPGNYLNLFIILIIKFCYAVVVGLSIDAVFRLRNRKKEKLNIEEKSSKNSKENSDKIKDKDLKSASKNEIIDCSHNLHKEEKCEETENKKSNLETNEEVIILDNEEIKGCCKHKLEHESNKIKDIFIHPLIHSLTIFAFIFVLNFAFSLIIELVGESAIVNFLSSTGFFEPILASIVGLIPNCASSVILTEVFLLGGISIGSCIAGLCVNSGLAIIMLFKFNKNLKENIFILASLFLLSCFIGIILNLII